MKPPTFRLLASLAGLAVALVLSSPALADDEDPDPPAEEDNAAPAEPDAPPPVAPDALPDQAAPPGAPPPEVDRSEALRRAQQLAPANRTLKPAAPTPRGPAAQTFPSALTPTPGRLPPPNAATRPSPPPAGPRTASPDPEVRSFAPSAASAEAALAPYAFDFQNAPVEQIFTQYAELTGRTVLQPATLTGQIKLTTAPGADLTRDEAIQALDGALALNNITMIPLGEKFVKAVPVAQSIQEGGALNYYEADQIPDAEQFATHVVQLKVALPSEVMQLISSFSKNPQGIVALDSSQILVIRDYASNIKRMIELIKKIDIQPEREYKLEVIPIKYGRVTELFDTMNSLISGSGGGSVSRAGATTQGRNTRSSLTPAGTASTGGRYGSRGSSSRLTGGRTGMTGTGVQPQQTGLTGQTGIGTTTGSSFQQRLNQIISSASGESQIEVLGDARIVPNEQSNSLIVYANKQDMEMITNIVAKVDVLLAQVLIEGIVVGVSLNEGQELGVSIAQHAKQFGNDFTGAGVSDNTTGFFGALTNFPSSAPDGFSYWGRLGSDITFAVKAFASDNRVRILQRPRIQTSHAVPGMFFSGDTVPYITGFSDYGYNIGYSTRSSIDYMDVGVQLDVTPYITPDGLVVLDISQQISQVSGYKQIEGNDVPTTTTRSASATLSVHDGETIMLGGYIEESRDKRVSGVPILKDIPLLGAAFRSRKEENSRKELILLMKVTVLKSPADASVLAATERAQLPGISKAEEEMEQTDKKRSKR